MKKLITVALILIMALSMTSICFAAAADVPGTKSIDVSAKYIENIKGVYKQFISSGKASLTLPDGSVVTVDGSLPEGIRLVIIPITKDDKEAYDWFSDCMKNDGTNICPYDIYFEDENGNLVTLDTEITVTITTPNEYTSPVICYVAADGKATTLESTSNGKAITFKTTHNSYYVAAEKKSVQPPVEPINPEKPAESDSPQTGDGNNITLWFTLLLLSAGALSIFIAYNKRSKKQTENND